MSSIFRTVALRPLNVGAPRYSRHMRTTPGQERINPDHFLFGLGLVSDGRPHACVQLPTMLKPRARRHLWAHVFHEVHGMARFDSSLSWSQG